MQLNRVSTIIISFSRTLSTARGPTGLPSQLTYLPSTRTVAILLHFPETFPALPLVTRQGLTFCFTEKNKGIGWGLRGLASTKSTGLHTSTCSDHRPHPSCYNGGEPTSRICVLYPISSPSPLLTPLSTFFLSSSDNRAHKHTCMFSTLKTKTRINLHQPLP